MILPGHLAAALLVSRAFRVDRHGSLLASMFPDVIDKPIRWLFRLTPNDRLPAHTGLVWAVTTGLVCLWKGSTFGKDWFVGYGSHLCCDQVNAYLNPGRIYFWWPFKRYRLHVGPTGVHSSLQDFSRASLLLELALSLLGIWVWFRKKRDYVKLEGEE